VRRRVEYNRQREGYQSLVSEIERSAAALGHGAPEDAASSSLASLMQLLEESWRDLSGSESEEEFGRWLEQTATGEIEDSSPAALRYLDFLDGFLIAAIQEIEELRSRDMTAADAEAELTRIWRHTYAYASARDEERLRRIWLRRGLVIKRNHPDAIGRQRIYKTSLAPSAAGMLFEHVEAIRAKLIEGNVYAAASVEQRLTFITEVLALLSTVRPFRIETRLGRSRAFGDWPRILRWWLAKGSLVQQPRPNEITNWYEFVASNFIHRGVWGVGSVLGLLLTVSDGVQPIQALEIDDWPRSGLPWIAFWLKELLTWGTLEPVAAFLLARGDALGRAEAENAATTYYAQLPAGLDANERLNPRRVRSWVEAGRVRPDTRREPAQLNVNVTLERRAESYLQSVLVVAPIEAGRGIRWIDPAGYVVAQGNRPETWPTALSNYQFELSVLETQVRGEKYLPHREDL
jgi:hypothetical protein